MTISIVQGFTDSNTIVGSGCSVTLTGVTAGNTVIAVAEWAGAVTISSATCGGTAMITRETHGGSIGGIANINAAWFDLSNIASTGDKTITITLSGVPETMTVSAAEITGAATPTFNASGKEYHSGSTDCEATVTTTANNCAIFAMCEQAAGAAPTVTSTYTAEDIPGVAWYNQLVWKLDVGTAGAKQAGETAEDVTDTLVLAVAYTDGGAPAVTRVQSLTLRDESGNPLANLTGLNCFGWDVNVPASVASTLPVDYTATGTTDGAGVLNFVRTNTTLVAGNLAYMLVTNDQTPITRSFFARVQITEL